MINRLF